MIVSAEFKRTAAIHKDADAACGRKWECACAPCIQVRYGVTKEEWLKQMRRPKLKRDPAGRTCPECAEQLGETIPLDRNGTCHGCGCNFGKRGTA